MINIWNVSHDSMIFFMKCGIQFTFCYCCHFALLKAFLVFDELTKNEVSDIDLYMHLSLDNLLT